MLAAIVLTWAVAIVLTLLGLALAVTIFLAAGMTPVPGSPWKESPGLCWTSVGLCVAGILLIALLMWSQPAAAAQAQPGCSHMPWPQMRAELSGGYGEEPVAAGLISPKTMVTVMARPDGASFTIVAVTVGGLACVLATGTGWGQKVLPAKGVPS